MTESIKSINIDVQKKRAGEAVVAKQCDAKSRFLRVTVCSGGTKITVAQDAEAVINASRPDGASKSFFCTVNGDGTVTAPLTGWMLECAGVLRCSVSVLGGDGERLTSTTFFVDVEPAEVTDGDIEHDESVDVLAELVVECREAKNNAQAAVYAANGAVSAANEAARAANGAMTSANEAAGTALSAAGAANEAASSANSAAASARAVADSKLDKSAVVQEAGGGGDVVMSQRAVTEAIAAGDTQGVNLLTHSHEKIENSYYNIAVYPTTAPVEAGTVYTITIWGALGEGATAFSAYAGDESFKFTAKDGESSFTNIADGVYRIIGSVSRVDSPNYLSIYVSKESSDIYNTIYKIKMERGAVENPVWTPAPEDIVTSWSGAGFHNSIFRGKYLGDAVTDAQYAAISAGTFDDLYVGDYWTIGGRNWVIAGLDYFYYTGDSALTKHHAVIIPEKCLYNAQMNDTSTTAGGYALSQMRSQNLDEAKDMINAAFPGHVLTYRGILTNAVADGHPTGYSWADCSVELMTEVMCYGTHFYASVANNGSSLPDLHTTFKMQLPVFRMAPYLITMRDANIWLQDVSTPTEFCLVNVCGNTEYADPTAPYGVRPFFLIGG